MGEELAGVSRTAVWTAMLRAGESRRADRLFDDPLAAVFVSAVGGGVAAETAEVPAGAGEFLAIRTRWFDDQARAACAGGIRQVVLLAAGLDCRAFRLDWPDGVRLFEVDLPALFEVKEAVLASAAAMARCERTIVGLDLRDPWAPTLTAGGFDPAVPTVWLAEGLLPYLDATHRTDLLATATELSAPDTRLAFDYLQATADDQPAMRATTEAVRRMGATLITTADGPEDWLNTHGWHTDQARVPALGEHYGRPLPTGIDMGASNATVLTTATR